MVDHHPTAASRVRRHVSLARDRLAGCSAMLAHPLSVDAFLELDLEKARREGGTAVRVLSSRKRPKPRVSQIEVDEEVRRRTLEISKLLV